MRLRHLNNRPILPVLSLVASAAMLVACTGSSSSKHTSTSPSTKQVHTNSAVGNPATEAAWSPVTSGSPVAGKHCQLRTSAAGSIPDPSCSPGIVTKDVTATNVRATVCRAASGSTRSLDPAATTTALAAIGPAYRISGSALSGYRLAFVVPPQLGGANAYGNMWPIPVTDFTRPGKDAYVAVVRRVETAVCDGQTGLQAAQYALANSWPSALTLLRLG